MSEVDDQVVDRVVQVSDSEFVFELTKDLSRQDKFPWLEVPCYIFGGWVRDLLRGVSPNDMDMQVPDLEVAEALIESLVQSNRIIHLERRITKDVPSIESSLEYQCMYMEIRTPRTTGLKIDISYSKATSLGDDSLNNCDFTANNLKINRFGNISTRIKAYQIGMAKKYNDAEWTAKCIRDCIEGKLVWMIPNRFSKSMGATEASQTEFMEKMNMRLQKMLSKGFVLTGEEERYLTSFRLAQ
jgi:hypothetical protein